MVWGAKGSLQPSLVWCASVFVGYGTGSNDTTYATSGSTTLGASYMGGGGSPGLLQVHLLPEGVQVWEW